MKEILITLIAGIMSLNITSAQEDGSTLIKTGENAPVFTCTTIDGKRLEISKLHGKIIMINFFATWCGPCNLELPHLQESIWDKYRNNSKFILVILGREHSEKEVRDFVASKKFTMPFAPDPEREIYGLYATKFVPRNVIIGKDGKILFQNSGFTTEEFRKIEDILAEQLK